MVLSMARGCRVMAKLKTKGKGFFSEISLSNWEIITIIIIIIIITLFKSQWI